jgi:hypothetical protein
MIDAHGVFHEVYQKYLTLCEHALIGCGRRYGLDDLEVRDVRGLPFDGSRTEIWWTRENRLVRWIELRMEAKDDRMVYTIRGGD